MRSQLLGAQISHIHNFLVVTGDPVPSMVRSSVNANFNHGISSKDDLVIDGGKFTGGYSRGNMASFN